MTGALGATASTIFFTADSVSRTDRFRATTSLATRRISASVPRASSARACPIVNRPDATSCRASSGSFRSRRTFATVARSFPTAAAMLFLRQLEVVGESTVGERLVDRVQVLALNVLDQRHFEQRAFAVRGRHP